MADIQSPADLRIVLIANHGYLTADDPELVERCTRSDLVVCLGGVDLNVVASVLPAKKPALCVLGPKDDTTVPAPFKALHGAGRAFRDWTVAGLCGALRLPGANLSGLYLSEAEAQAMLENLPPANIFLSASYPQGLQESGLLSEHGFQAIDRYLQKTPAPIYHFYAHPEETIVEEIGETLSVGVNGIFEPPLLSFV